MNTVFRDNAASYRGVGLFGAIAEDCWIVANRTETDGGDGGPGTGAYDCSLLRCTVEDNEAFAFEGGGTAECDLVDCIVRGNRISSGGEARGAGVYGGTALRCLLEGNEMGFNGHGAGAANADLTQCLIVRNYSEGGGGGTFNCNLDRCTVVQNYANYGNDFSDPAVGGVLESGFGGAHTMRSSVVWGNVGLNLAGPVDVTYSTVEGGANGVGNLDLNPAFFGPGSDLHLTALSPCIDAGDPNAPVDPDGSRADMGALPFLANWARTDGPMCIGAFDMVAVGSPSYSGPVAYLQAEELTFFALAADAQITPIQVSGGFNYSFHCFSNGLRRVLPSSTGRLDLTPQLLGSLGFLPGDRMFVAGWNNGRVSITWDLGVVP